MMVIGVTMKNPDAFILFAFYVMASFVSFAGLVVMGMALLQHDAEWDKALRGMVVFIVFALIGRFANSALEESEGV